LAVSLASSREPDDRKRLGLMLDATLAENITSVAWLARRAGRRLLRPRVLVMLRAINESLVPRG
jgi:hypothetical protein